MIKIIKILTPIFALILCTSCASAQTWEKYGKVTHEVGFLSGAAFFSTDYGQRFELKSSGAGNVGMGIGIIHYITFADYRYRWNQKTSFFRDHFRFRNELSYFNAKLDHFGIYVDESQTSDAAEKLRSMHGNAQVINLGTQLEYHFVNITEFGSRRNKYLLVSPYLSIGAMGVYSMPQLISDYGDGDWEADQSILYEKWAVADAVDMDPKLIFSVTASAGSRFKLGEFSDVFVEAKWQYYLSDWVEGLNATEPTSPINTSGPNNLFNDWSIFLNIGYVFYLN